MNSNLPVLPSNDEWQRIKDISHLAVKSGLLPSSIKTPEQAAIIALKGRELGLPPMVAFAHLHVVNGKPGCSAELLLAGIRERYPDAVIKFVVSDSKACRIQAKRPKDDSFQEFSFTIEEAKIAGLLSKDVWKNYPTDMLRARAITRMKRAVFSEVMMGLSHTPEELDETRDVTPTAAPPQAQEAIKTQKIRNVAPQTADEAKNWEPQQQPPKVNTAVNERDHLAAKIIEACKKLGISSSEDMHKEAVEIIGVGVREMTTGQLEVFLEGLTTKLQEQKNV